MQTQCATTDVAKISSEPSEETKRDRVRRLLIDKLKSDGMRFERGTPVEDQRRRLDRMADDLSYMADERLGWLRDCLKTKGEGSRRNFWPCRITVLGYAEQAQPRPLEDWPGLKGWFVSAAGQAAIATPGRLLAEFKFWTKYKRPPSKPYELEAVAREARQIADRRDRLVSRRDRNVLTDEEDIRWLGVVEQREAQLVGWVREGNKE
jgi:hypothetical protein